MIRLTEFLNRFQNGNSSDKWFSLEADVRSYLESLSEDDVIDFLDKFPYESLCMICDGLRVDQDKNYYEKNEAFVIKVK